jgi:hypothetical protein
LSRRGAICPPAALDYVVPSRVDVLLCSPSGLAVSLGGIRSVPGQCSQEGVEVLCP